VRGAAKGKGGIGVQGNGKKFGVFSSGPLGVANGKPLSCTGCVAPAALAKAAKALQPLGHHESESGGFGGASGSAVGNIGDGITFVRPLATPISESNVIEVLPLAAPVLHCEGQGSADPGYLCLYDYFRVGIVSLGAYTSLLGTGGKFGANLFWSVTGGNSYVSGTYTVTAR
jgi:hypothetical protein